MGINEFIVALGPLFAILNAILIPTHILLLRRSFRIADRFTIISGLPPGILAQNMKVQRKGDLDAYRQTFICAGIVIFMGTITVRNVFVYLL